METALFCKQIVPNRSLKTAFLLKKTAPSRGLETTFFLQNHCPKHRFGNSISLSNKTVLNRALEKTLLLEKTAPSTGLEIALSFQKHCPKQKFGNSTSFAKTLPQAELWKQHFPFKQNCSKQIFVKSISLGKKLPQAEVWKHTFLQKKCSKQRFGNSTSFSNPLPQAEVWKQYFPFKQNCLKQFWKKHLSWKKPSQTEVWKQHFFGFKRSLCFSCLCLKAYNNIGLVYTKFHALSYKFFVFWGGTIFVWFDAFFNTFGPSLTKVVYARFDGSSHQRTCLQITRQHRKIKKHVMLERSHATNGRFPQLFVFLQRQLFSAVQVSELISGNAFFPVHHQIESEHL